MGNIIDGKALSLVVKDEVKAQVTELEAKMVANRVWLSL